MPERLIEGLKRFKSEHFPQFREQYERLAREGQRPTVLFIGCSDSRLLPNLLMDTSPGEIFMIRNVANFVPPFEPDSGFHGTSAAIEFAVTTFGITDIIVCGHTDCGGIRALYAAPNEATPNLTKWLELGRPAMLEGEMTDELLRDTEKRSVVVQMERLLTYPMIAERFEAGRLSIHGWMFVLDRGEVVSLDVQTGRFVPLA